MPAAPVVEVIRIGGVGVEKRREGGERKFGFVCITAGPASNDAAAGLRREGTKGESLNGLDYGRASGTTRGCVFDGMNAET